MCNNHVMCEEKNGNWSVVTGTIALSACRLTAGNSNVLDVEMLVLKRNFNDYSLCFIPSQRHLNPVIQSTPCLKHKMNKVEN